MDQEKIKIIIRNMELLIDALKTELYPKNNSYGYDDIDPIDLKYGQIYEDD